MVTDRRRFGDRWRAELPARVAAAARAGIDLIQIRERDLDGGLLFALTRDCVAATAGTRSRVLVNERFDVALAAGAHGVHLRSDSFEAYRVRAHARRPFLIGRSVHDPATAAAAAPGEVDYLLFGTVFETASKPDRQPSGTDALRVAVTRARVPVLAIGGITLDNVAAVADTGAAGVAAIGMFMDGVPSDLTNRADRARFLFDSRNAGSLT